MALHEPRCVDPAVCVCAPVCVWSCPQAVISDSFSGAVDDPDGLLTMTQYSKSVDTANATPSKRHARPSLDDDDAAAVPVEGDVLLDGLAVSRRRGSGASGFAVTDASLLQDSPPPMDEQVRAEMLVRQRRISALRRRTSDVDRAAMAAAQLAMMHPLAAAQVLAAQGAGVASAGAGGTSAGGTSAGVTSAGVTSAGAATPPVLVPQIPLYVPQSLSNVGDGAAASAVSPSSSPAPAASGAATPGPSPVSSSPAMTPGGASSGIVVQLPGPQSSGSRDKPPAGSQSGHGHGGHGAAAPPIVAMEQGAGVYAVNPASVNTISSITVAPPNAAQGDLAIERISDDSRGIPPAVAEE
jgi:hypothetical protein